MRIEKVLRDLNIIEYTFCEVSKTIKTEDNTIFQLRALLKITDTLMKSNLEFIVDENYNILLTQ